jgi:hypothetical protein
MYYENNLTPLYRKWSKNPKIKKTPQNMRGFFEHRDFTVV